MLMHLHIVYDCFRATEAERNGFDRDHFHDFALLFKTVMTLSQSTSSATHTVRHIFITRAYSS